MYLARCIDSILTQDYTNFELLLIDDGSTDSSGVVCDKYAQQDGRVRVYHKSNEGVSSARNVGIDNAQGELVVFVDSDDYVLPSFLSNYIGINVDLVIQGIVPNYELSFDFVLSKTSIDYVGNVADGLRLMIECQMLGSLCNKLFRRDIIVNNNIKLNSSYVYREDEEFLLRYLRFAKDIRCTTSAGYVYLIPTLSKYRGLHNLPVIYSMYQSVVTIYKGEANVVTDSYQSQLYQEWLSSCRSNWIEALNFFPQIMRVVGLRIVRVLPLKSVLRKLWEFIKK
jgi:glycosyltransferase involved in cell wall biosynthesis